MVETTIRMDRDRQRLDMVMNHYGHNVSIINEPYYCADCEEYLAGLVIGEDSTYGTNNPL